MVFAVNPNSINPAREILASCLKIFPCRASNRLTKYPGRRVIAAEKQSYLQANKGSGASRTGVPKLERENEAQLALRFKRHLFRRLDWCSRQQRVEG
jgi:hypothetical protein